MANNIWITVLIGLLSVDGALSSQCACATTDVHVRSGAGVSHSIVTALTSGHCLGFKGHRQTTSDGASWVNVDYHGHNGWINGYYVTISTCHGSSSSQVQLSGCPNIVTRAEWGARAPFWTVPRLTQTPRYMFIHHGASPACHSKSDCIHRVRSYQDYHMDTHGWPDIGFSFVVGEDGNVYEGRGWDQVGAHTHGYNDIGLAICVIGDFTAHVPNHAAQTVVKQLIACGQAHGKLTSNYLLRGHRDVVSTDCPGTKFYDLIRTWPHY